ncbi:MAG: alpha/beta hydrolase, partial [Dokdonella sp.]
IIWAISGGGAYGCVMARDLPDRVCGVLSVCGMMPATAGERANLNAFVRFGLFLAKLPAPLGNPLFRAVYRSMAKSNSPATRNRLLKRLPEGSRQDAMEDNLFRFIALSGETNFNAGPAGVRQEMRLYGADAETLDLRKITVPFTIMHGEKDINVPIDIARRVEAAIPHSKAIYYPGEDHTFWWPNRQRMIDEIKLIAAS